MVEMCHCGASVTPALLGGSPLQAAPNETLVLRGSRLGGSAAPEVTLCGGASCAVLSYNDSHSRMNVPISGFTLYATELLANARCPSYSHHLPDLA